MSCSLIAGNITCSSGIHLAVLVGHILRQPENFGKKLDEISWSDYDASPGYTLELCAGLIDKVSLVEPLEAFQVQ